MKLVLLLALATLTLAACGGVSRSVDPGSEGPPRYDLTITYWPTGRDGDSRSATLTCDPDGGTHPDPNGACDMLLENEDALKPVPGDVACTEIYGGPQLATISGSGVDATLSRTNGCEIARWDALAPLLRLRD
jgi:hypothetical protein